MNKYSKVLLAATTMLAVTPVVVAAEEVEYIKWKDKVDTYHLYDDVRTIAFSSAVDPASLKGITIWNDTTNTAVATVATIGEKDNQVKVKLAEGAEYTNHHTYTLTVKGVKQLASQKVNAPTKYTYKMVYKTPEQVSFKKSYLVTNTSDEIASLRLPEGATYITYDAFGTVEPTNRSGINTGSNHSVTLSKGGQMTVSFMDDTQLTVPAQFSIKETKDASHLIYKLYERNNIKITGQDRASYPTVFYGSKEDKLYTSYTHYKHQSDSSAVESFDYRVETNKTFNGLSIFKLNNAVITNEDDGVLYVYAPNTSYALSTVEVVDEKAAVATELKRNEIVQANSSSPAYSTDLKFIVPQGEPRISAAIYSAKGTENVKYNQHPFTYLSNTYIDVTGDLILKNEGGLPLTLAGPGRFVTFKPTTEEPVITQSVRENERIKVTSTAVEKELFAIQDLSKKGMYSELNYRDNILNAISLNKETYLYGDTKHSMSPINTMLFENTSKQELLFYGAARTTKFETIKSPLLTKMDLAPGEKITLSTTKTVTQYLIADPSGKGTLLQTTSDGDSRTYQDSKGFSSTLSANKPIIFENKGNTTFTIHGAVGEVTFTK